MKPTPAQLRAKLTTALERERGYVQTCMTCDQRNNPQIITMRLKAEGRTDALEAVLLALRGDMSPLNSICGE